MSGGQGSRRSDAFWTRDSFGAAGPMHCRYRRRWTLQQPAGECKDTVGERGYAGLRRACGQDAFKGFHLLCDGLPDVNIRGNRVSPSPCRGGVSRSQQRLRNGETGFPQPPPCGEGLSVGARRRRASTPSQEEPVFIVSLCGAAAWRTDAATRLNAPTKQANEWETNKRMRTVCLPGRRANSAAGRARAP